MPLFDEIVGFLKSIYPSLIQTGILLPVLYFLSKRLIKQILEKEIIDYKIEIETKYKQVYDINKKNYEVEYQKLENLWQIINEIFTICSKYEFDKDCVILSKLTNALESFLNENKPFIDNELDNNIQEIIDIIDIENFQSDDYNKLMYHRSVIIKIIQEKLHIK